MSRIRVYIAGAISAPNLIQGLTNIKRGIEAGHDLLKAGYAPFTPHLDFLFLLVRGPEKIEVQDFYDYSLAWMEQAQAILVLPNSENSKGVQAELVRAQELNIPIYDTMEELCIKMPA